MIDLGCGTGRVAVPLALAGHDVTGVDLSLPMLAVAASKASVGLRVRWAVGNIAELSAFRDGVFDAAVCLFSTLGMVAGAVNRRRAVAEAFRVLRPDGRYVVHAHLVGHHLATRAGRRLWLRDRCARLLRRRDAGDVAMPAGPGGGWTMHLFTRRELVNLLTGVGFMIVEARTIGVDGRPRSWPARHWGYGLLIAARRPA